MESPYKGRTGLRRALDATRYSLAGLAAALKHEAAFRELFALCVILVPAALWLGDGGAERALLAASALLPLVVELLNAAIEAAIDRISLERHPLAKRAKDLGSAAVMVSLFVAALVWVIVLAG